MPRLSVVKQPRPRPVPPLATTLPRQHLLGGFRRPVAQERVRDTEVERSMRRLQLPDDGGLRERTG
jgi:hypothetical protein